MSIDYLLAIIKRIYTRCFNRKNFFYNYACRLLDIVGQALLLLIATVFLDIVLLYLCKILWRVYIITPVGSTYVEVFTEKAETISHILNKDFIGFSIEVTLFAFGVCMMISGLCRLFHIARYLYLPRGFFGKIGFWGLPLTVAVAEYIQPVYDIKELKIAYIVAFVPTLCIFTSCFRFTTIMLPEIGDIINKGIKVKNNFVRLGLPKIKERLKEVIDRINAS